jgi:hypothetical protein
MGQPSGIANSFSYNSRLQPVNMSATAPVCNGSGCTAAVTISGGLNTTASSSGVSAPNAAANSALAAYFDANGVYHLVYQGSNQHLYEIYASNNVATGAPLAAAGSALTFFLDSSNWPHWSYIGSDQNVYLIYTSPTSTGGCDVSLLAIGTLTERGSNFWPCCNSIWKIIGAGLRPFYFPPGEDFKVGKALMVLTPALFPPMVASESFLPPKEEEPNP